MSHVSPAHADNTAPSRRTVLRAGAAIGIGTVVVATATSCDRGPDPNQTTAQALLGLTRSARNDAAAARALAPLVTEYSAALGVVASQRAAHATALRDEILRLDPDVAESLERPASPDRSGPSASATSTRDSTAPRGPATLDELKSALTAAARTARDTAIALSGYSAGLAGSISASTTTLAEVQLA